MRRSSRIQRFWTPGEVETLIDLHAQGVIHKVIGAQLGRSHASVECMLHRLSQEGRIVRKFSKKSRVKS